MQPDLKEYKIKVLKDREHLNYLPDRTLLDMICEFQSAKKSNIPPFLSWRFGILDEYGLLDGEQPAYTALGTALVEKNNGPELPNGETVSVVWLNKYFQELELDAKKRYMDEVLTELAPIMPDVTYTIVTGCLLRSQPHCVTPVVVSEADAIKGDNISLNGGQIPASFFAGSENESLEYFIGERRKNNKVALSSEVQTPVSPKAIELTPGGWKAIEDHFPGIAVYI